MYSLTHIFSTYLLTELSPKHVQFVLFIVRISIGVLTIGHGLPKILGGPNMWIALGQAISQMGIRSRFMFWGFLAACSEFFGGIMLCLGLLTRIITIPLSITMLVATVMHIRNNDNFNAYSFSLLTLITFLLFWALGSGPISLDYYLFL